MEQYVLLPKLIKEHGETLKNELAYLMLDNGTGDCWGCECSVYCSGKSCVEAVKIAIDKILEEASK